MNESSLAVNRMKILAVSDVELGFIYTPQIATISKDIDLVISCGDLPYYYLEFMVSILDKPLYFVRGNHAVKWRTLSRVNVPHHGAPWICTNAYARFRTAF